MTTNYSVKEMRPPWVVALHDAQAKHPGARLRPSRGLLELVQDGEVVFRVRVPDERDKPIVMPSTRRR